MTRLSSVLLVLCFFASNSEPARILGVFPTPSISHQVVFSALTIELSNRGHELFIFTTDPVKNSSLVNYKEIDMHHMYALMLNLIDKVGDAWMETWMETSVALSDAVLAHPEMQRLIAPNSTEHFDLIIVEFLTFEAIYALQTRIKAPMMGIVSLPMPPFAHYVIGNPYALAYSPGFLDPYTDEMNFWQRLYHVYRHLSFNFKHRFSCLARQDEIVKKYFGNNTPHVSDLGKEISVILANSNQALLYPRPNLPGIIDIGGLHLKMKMKGLEKNLKNFLDSATEGFVYFSLGSNAKSDQLPAEKLNTLKSVFASLPCKVLWKWESDTLPGKPENVFISKWLPQHDVLAHPNIKVFIYQGGLQSTEEAMTLGVPLIGIPLFADQEFNVRKIASVNAGLRISFDPLSGDELKEAIIKVITDKSYKEGISKLYKIYNDRQNDPMETAVWWTEYVIRHNGAPHMRTRARYLAWYQRELLDILGFSLLAVLLIFYIGYRVILSQAVRYVRPSVKVKSQ